MRVRLTLPFSLVAGVSQGLTDGAVVPGAVLPVQDDLSRGGAVIHCGNGEKKKS